VLSDGRCHEASCGGAGRGARGSGYAARHSGRSGTPPAGTKAGCEELADGGGAELPSTKSAAPEREIAAVERREAGILRKDARASQGAKMVGRLPALRSPRFGEKERNAGEPGA